MSLNLNFVVRPLIVSMCLITATNVMAQYRGVGGVNAPMGMINSYNPGSYNFENYSKSQVYQDFIKNLNDRNKQAAQMYQDSVKQFFAAFKDYYSYANDKLIAAGQNSIATENKGLALADYLTLVRNYNQMKTNVDLGIESVALFTDSVKGRIATDAPGTGINSVATVTEGLDFKAVAKKFSDAVEALDTAVKTTDIKVQLKTGAPHVAKLLDVSFVKNVYTGKEIEDLRSQVEDKRSLSDEQVSRLTAYSNKLLQQIQIVLSEYGKKEGWRWNAHDAEYEARKKKVIEDIVDAFWQRSYFRMNYGINLGAIAISYNTRVLAADRFFTNLNKLTFYPILRDRNDLISTERQLAEVLKTSGDKGKAFSDILHGRVGVLDSANSIVSAIMGQDETAKALAPIVGLILNDMHEEELALDGKRNELIMAYKARYYDTTKPNSKNPNGYSDREVFKMRELQFDFSQTRMNKLKADGQIPTVVVRQNLINNDSVFGLGQKALTVAISKIADYANAESIQAEIEAYEDSIKDQSGQSDVGNLLDN